MGLGKGYPAGILKKSANYHDKAYMDGIRQASTGENPSVTLFNAQYRARSILGYSAYARLLPALDEKDIAAKTAVFSSTTENSDALQNWIDAMKETDALAGDRRPETMAAYAREAEACAAFVAWAEGKNK